MEQTDRIITQKDIDSLPNNYIRQASWSILNQVVGNEVSVQLDKRSLLRKLIEIPMGMPLIGKLFSRIDYTKYGHRTEYLNRY